MVFGKLDATLCVLSVGIAMECGRFQKEVWQNMCSHRCVKGGDARGEKGEETFFQPQKTPGSKKTSS
ncbi:MAG TPA: hypothetical protein VGF67_11485 [Ktedonobacteraceae bacterium]|jgi:hypothetical protein